MSSIPISHLHQHQLPAGNRWDCTVAFHMFFPKTFHLCFSDSMPSSLIHYKCNSLLVYQKWEPVIKQGHYREKYSHTAAQRARVTSVLLGRMRTSLWISFKPRLRKRNTCWKDPLSCSTWGSWLLVCTHPIFIPNEPCNLSQWENCSVQVGTGGESHGRSLQPRVSCTSAATLSPSSPLLLKLRKENNTRKREALRTTSWRSSWPVWCKRGISQLKLASTSSASHSQNRFFSCIKTKWKLELQRAPPSPTHSPDEQ